MSTLQELFNTIVKMAGDKQDNFESSSKFFAFKAQCDRVKFWLSERQKDLLSIKSSQESSLKVDEICKSILSYESNITQLRGTAKKLADEVPSRMNHVYQALQEVEKLWANLDSIRQTSERRIINSVQLEKFKKTCTDTIDWMQEKLLYVDSLDSMFTVNALDNMTRRHKALKRELIPIKERISEVRAAYANVTRTFTEDASSVTPNVEKMIGLYEELVQKLEMKEQELIRLGYQQKFEKMSKEYVKWAGDQQRQLEQSPVQDIAFIEDSKVMVEEMEAELERKNDDYEEILEIGGALIEASDKNSVVSKDLAEVQAVTNALRQTIAEHKDAIHRIEEYKNFTQESRVIESHISSCRRLLFDQVDRQLSEDELNDMSKRQLLLAAMIESYENRVEKFIEAASNLNPECHIRYEDCVHKKDKVAKDWQELNDDFTKCQSKLQDNRTFLDLATTIDEMEKFIGEKEKLAHDMSYRDPIHLR